jgi:hypothetical protein
MSQNNQNNQNNQNISNNNNFLKRNRFASREEEEKEEEKNSKNSSFVDEIYNPQEEEVKVATEEEEEEELHIGDQSYEESYNGENEELHNDMMLDSVPSTRVGILEFLREGNILSDEDLDHYRPEIRAMTGQDRIDLEIQLNLEAQRAYQELQNLAQPHAIRWHQSSPQIVEAQGFEVIMDDLHEEDDDHDNHQNIQTELQDELTRLNLIQTPATYVERQGNRVVFLDTSGFATLISKKTRPFTAMMIPLLFEELVIKTSREDALRALLSTNKYNR